MTNTLNKLLLAGTAGLVAAGCNSTKDGEFYGTWKGNEVTVERTYDGNKIPERRVTIKRIHGDSTRYIPGVPYSMADHLVGVDLNRNGFFEQDEIILYGTPLSEWLADPKLEPLFPDASSDSLNVAYREVLRQNGREVK